MSKGFPKGILQKLKIFSRNCAGPFQEHDAVFKRKKAGTSCEIRAIKSTISYISAIIYVIL